MQNYFRITAYHPTENISVIMDSYGKFEKLWQFSSYIVSKGFKVLEVDTEETFLDGNLQKIESKQDKIMLRASKEGKPTITSFTENNKTYNKIIINNNNYITLKN